MGVAVVSRPPAHAEESPVFLAVAHHYPRPEHLGAVVVVMCDVETGMAGTPGLISIESFRKVVETRLPAISRWESPEAAQAGVPSAHVNRRARPQVVRRSGRGLPARGRRPMRRGRRVVVSRRGTRGMRGDVAR
jgi:heme-degrading monooxygenase HmoA